MAFTALTAISGMTITGGVTAKATSASAFALSPDAYLRSFVQKLYFEATVNVSTDSAGDNAIGVGTPSAVFSTNGANMAVCYFAFSNGTIYANGSNTGITVGGTLVANDVLCVAVDFANNLIWFRKNAGNWNNSGTANPATATGGVAIPSALTALAPCVNLHAVNDQVTCNFGGSSFAQTVPSGFTSGWPVSTSTSAIVTQASVEHFVAPNPAAQVTQVGVEHFIAPHPILQVTQAALEEWGASLPAVRVTQVAVEEWGSVHLAAIGTGEVEAFATVVGTATAPAEAAGMGEADASADVEGAGVAALVGAGEADAYATVSGIGVALAPPNSLPFLPGLGWSVHRRPTFDTIVAAHPSGAEVRLALWQNCLWEFELTYDALASNAAYPGSGNKTLQTLMGFYLARGGQRGTFLYIDPDFNAVAGQGIGAGDGTTLRFPFYRVFGGQVEPVSWVTATAAIYLDGVAQPSGWTVSGNVLSFVSAPGDGVVISADFTYGFVCRFLEDNIDFEEFMDNLWQLKSLKFRQVRL